MAFHALYSTIHVHKMLTFKNMYSCQGDIIYISALYMFPSNGLDLKHESDQKRKMEFIKLSKQNSCNARHVDLEYRSFDISLS